MNLLNTIGTIFAGIGLAIHSFIFGAPPEQVVPIEAPSEQSSNQLGAVQEVGGFPYFLAGSGINSSATSITLTSFTLPQNGYKIQDSDLSDTFYITLEPGNRNKQEFVSCTTVTQNAAGSATLSGCTRGLSPVTPYTASSTLKFSHSGGTIAIFSNPPQLYNQYGSLSDNEVITGYWTALDPISAQGIATKQYVLDHVSGGTVTTDALVVSGTAGETVSAGQAVYLKAADARWYKAGLDGTASTTMLGISQGAGTSGNAITGGVLLRGSETHQSGMSIGSTYYLGSTAGTISSTKSGRFMGVAKTATILYFDPYFTPTPQWGGLPFTVPSTQGASSTALMNDSTGNLSWGSVNSSFTASSTPSVSTGSASTTIYNTPIPGGALGTNNALRVVLKDVLWTPGTEILRVAAAYGNSTTTFGASFANNASRTRMRGDITFIVQANGVSAQREHLQMNVGSSTYQAGYNDTFLFGSQAGANPGNTWTGNATSTGAESSASTKNITIEVNSANAGFWTSGISITEILRQ